MSHRLASQFRLLLIIALCSSVPCPAAAATPVPPGAIDRVDTIVREGLEKHVASYSVAVVQDGRLVLARGYGFADLENSVPAVAETVYRLGSITKQFTSMAVMQLAEQGKLKLDDELTKFLPDYPTAGHKVTITQLLNHTSGIKSYTSLPNFFRTARMDHSHEQMLALFKDQPFDFEPGARWLYNNSGYYLLGMVIEKASGQSYSEYLTEHIFQPLGMHATRYGHTRPLIPHRAQGYRSVFGEIVNDDPISMTAPGAAGALVSTVLDLVKWHQALEAGDFISSASYEAMYRPTTLADGKVQQYGFGWGLGELSGHKKLSHGGGINGFSTVISRYPDDRLAVIVLSNTAGAPAGSIEAQIARMMLGIKEEPVADLPIEKGLLETLAGTYEMAEMKLKVTADDGKLFVSSPLAERDRLQYQGEQRFVSSARNEIRLKFQLSDGKATGVEIDMAGDKMSGKRVAP